MGHQALERTVSIGLSPGIRSSEQEFAASSQVIPEDVHVDARLFAVRSAKHVRVRITLMNEQHRLCC